MYSQPGIYNALDYNMSPTNTGRQNALALQAAVAAAEANGGGIVIIPSNDQIAPGGHGGVYPMAAQSQLANYAVQITGTKALMIMGTGGATTLQMESSGDLFQMPQTGEFTGQSLTFQDLIITYDQTKGPFTGTAFNLANNNAGTVNLCRLYFQDCEYAVNFFNILQGTMRDCTAVYTSSYPATQGAICITIGAPGAKNGSNQIEIDTCVLTTDSRITGSTGLLVTKVQGLRVRDTQIFDFDIGINVKPGGTDSSDNTTEMWFDSVEVSAYATAVQAQPTGAILPSISSLIFSNCVFAAAGASAARGVYVDTNGGASGKIDTVQLYGCVCSGFSDSGLLITSGQNIQILGGTYSGNGAAGIAVAGAPTSAVNVTIDGAICNGAAPGGTAVQINGISLEDGGTQIAIRDCQVSGNTQNGVYLTEGVQDANIQACDVTGNSENALSVTGLCKNICVDGCNMSGYPKGPLFVLQPGTLQVTNCAGYNDQGTVVSQAFPGNGTSFNAATLGWFGPLTFYLSSAPSDTVVEINGSSTSLSSGTFFLGPPAANGVGNAVISYKTGEPQPTFIAIGQ